MIATIEKSTRIFAPLASAACLLLFGACTTPASPPTQVAAEVNEKAGDICQRTMSFDVSGFYFSKCVDYLNAHSQPQKVAVNMSAPAEHRACGEIGLAEGSPEFMSCVQQMYQLDLGAQHL
jgi:hypothetical protein